MLNFKWAEDKADSLVELFYQKATMREKYRCVRNVGAPENFNIVHQLAVNLLKKSPLNWASNEND